MMGAGWGMSLRLAWREARRRPGRTALVTVVIALPVAALSVGLIVVRTGYQSPAEARAATIGQADQAFTTVSASPALGDRGAAIRSVADAAPDGSRVVAVTTAAEAVTRDDGHLDFVGLSDQPLDDPLFAGRLSLGEGRVPEGRDEIAASGDLLRGLDAAVGDEIDLLALGRVTVTGTLRETSANDVRMGAVVGAPLTPPPHQFAMGTASIRVFLDRPDGSDPVRAPQGLVEMSDAYGTDPEHARRQLGVAYAIGAVGLVLAGTVASAAFAVGARRYLRSLGVLAANGVPPAGLRRVMVLQGVVTGALASAVGIGAALVAGQAIEPHLDRWMARAVAPLDVPVPYLGLAWLMGVVASGAAAWVPARTAARVPVLSALAGRRPQSPARVLGPVAGAGLAAAGSVVLALYATRPRPPWGLGVAGAMLVLAGGTLCTPWLVAQCEPAAGRLRGAARLAARGLARNRLRTCAVVTAIMAPAAAATFGMTLVASQHDAWRDHQVRPDQVVVTGGFNDEAAAGGATSWVPPDDRLDEARRIVPGAAEAPLRLVSSPAHSHEPYLRVSWAPTTGASADDPATSAIAVASDDLLAALAAPAGTADLLDDNTVVALHPVPDDLVARPESPLAADRPVLFERTEVVVAQPAAATASYELPSFVVSQGWVDARGLDTFDAGLVMRSPRPLTADQRDALRPWHDLDLQDASIRSEVLGTAPPQAEPWTAAFADPDHDSDVAAAAVIAAAVLVFTLLVVAATLALSAAESRDERSMLQAIGVPPRVDRASRACEAALLPLLAMVVAIPLGVACAFVVLVALPDTGGVLVDPTVPWPVVGALLVGVPVVSGVVTRVAAALAAPLARPPDLVSGLACD